MLGILYLIFVLIFYIDLACIFPAVSACHKKKITGGNGRSFAIWQLYKEFGLHCRNSVLTELNILGVCSEEGDVSKLGAISGSSQNLPRDCELQALILGELLDTLMTGLVTVHEHHLERSRVLHEMSLPEVSAH